MIHFHGGRMPGAGARIGLLFGSGTYAYLPCDCTVGTIAIFVTNVGSGAARVTCQLVQNGGPIGSSVVVSEGPPVLWNPLDAGTVLPAVDATNLDTDGRLALDLALSGTAVADNVGVRLGIELLPVDPALRGAQILTLYATGEFTKYPSLFTSGGPATGYAVGYSTFPNTVPAFIDNVLNPDPGLVGSEQAEASSPAPVSHIGGHATPIARSGVVQNLMLVSADPAGFDGDYTLAARQNGHDALMAVATNDGNRIVTSGSNVAPYGRGDQFNFAVTQDSGSLLIGHVLALYVPAGAQSLGGGLGAGGLGARGLGG